MDLRDRLVSALEESESSGLEDKNDVIRLSTLRLIYKAIKDRDFTARSQDQCNGCEEEELLGILKTMVQQRKDSAQQYEKQGFFDLAERERMESKIILEFLPKLMTEDEVRRAAQRVVKELGGEGLKDAGRTIAALKERYRGKMNFTEAAAVVKDLLMHTHTV